jgi:valyl-tRNA synthetase
MSERTDMPKAYEPNEVEERWYPRWEKAKRFHGAPTPGKRPYAVVIPPPNVTGILTMGHVLNNTLQDILIRWRRMQGYEAAWFPGTDHAGIATESKVVQYLRETEGTTRDKLGRDEFIQRVWQWKEEYGGTIIRQLRKLGTSCDWERERFTMDEGLSLAVRKVFVQLYEKGYIYRGRRMINWCPVSRTALSDEEVIYREIHGYFYHIRYPLSDGSGHLTVATTRPETMLGDTAVAVHPDDPRYKDIVGKTIKLPLTGRKIPVIADTHADPKFGTGCVKITPAHDPNDFTVGLRHQLPVLNVMNDDGTMNEAAGEEFVGLDRFECREKVVTLLERGKLLEKTEPHLHSVGYSERGDVPIEPRVSEQWFVRMDELAKPAIEAVRDGRIKFHPDRWTKTYFHWMENIRDWCISRQIWWGHRIPAWYNDATGEIHVGIDEPTDSGNWRQDEDVLDTWFSSWLWPFSIMDWPKPSADRDFFYPTADLVTGPDIIFFWVARMIMAGLEFMGEVPFRNVYFTSIIRDDQGRKLSKSLGNSPDPLDVIRTYGTDALRFAMIYIAPLGQDIFYSNDKCEIGKHFANKLWNASRFRSMQGPGRNVAGTDELDPAALTAADRWILGRFSQVAGSVTEALEKFRFHEATHTLYDFVWSEFCDWYVEAAKRQFDDPARRDTTLAALDFVLARILRLLHPFMPFVTEELSHHLGYLGDDESIMTAAWPTPLAPAELARLGIDEALVRHANAAFDLIRAGRNLRAQYNLPPGKRIAYAIRPADTAIGTFLAQETEMMAHLLRAEGLTIDDAYASDGAAAPSLVTDGGAIFLPLAGLVDTAAERVRLTKQREELIGWIRQSRGKLTNEKFLAKAPPQVVAEVRANLAELEEKLARVEIMLTGLK